MNELTDEDIKRMWIESYNDEAITLDEVSDTDVAVLRNFLRRVGEHLER